MSGRGAKRKSGTEEDEEETNSKRLKTENTNPDTAILPPTNAEVVETTSGSRSQNSFLNRRVSSGEEWRSPIDSANKVLKIDPTKFKMKDLLKHSHIGEPTQAAKKRKAEASEHRKNGKRSNKNSTEEEQKEKAMQAKERMEKFLKLHSTKKISQVEQDGNSIVLKDASEDVSQGERELGIVFEHANMTTNTSYRKRTPGDHWKEEETRNFFKALEMFGTDFSLMTYYFPKRTRKNLRNKFKQEEKKHPEEVEIALKNRREIDPKILEPFT